MGNHNFLLARSLEMIEKPLETSNFDRNRPDFRTFRPRNRDNSPPEGWSNRCLKMLKTGV